MYKGIRYRSRHEARWAVFMTELGLPFVYEPEGYKLKAGWYLPDFWLADLGLFIEIKPLGFNKDLSSKEYAKLESQATELALVTDVDLICICGNPHFRSDNESPNDWAYDATHMGTWWDDSYLWCECPFCQTIGLQYGGRSARNKHREGCPVDKKLDDKNYNWASSRLVIASLVAMNTRFETL